MQPSPQDPDRRSRTGPASNRLAVGFDDLERQAAFMRRAACEVVGVSDADDAVQDAWVSMLERPPGALEAPRAWLRRVVHHRAGTLRRSARNRARREEVVATARSSSVSTDSIEKLELVRRVAGAIESLPPSLREPMVLRTYDGLSQSAIAERLGLTTSAVHGRLHRGKEQLRQRLDRDYGDGRWALLLAPFAGIEPSAIVTLSHGAAAAESTARTSASIAAKSLSATTALMGFKSTAAIAACTVVAGLVALLVFVRGPDGLREAGPEAAAPTVNVAELASAARPSATESAPASVEAEGQRTAAAVAAVAVPAATTLEIEFVYAEDGAPAAGVPVRLGLARSFVADENGRVTWEPVPPGSRFVRVLGRGRFDIEIAEGRHNALRVEIPPGIDIAGRTVDDAGHPVPGAEIIDGEMPDIDGSQALGRSGSDGTFLLRSLSMGGAQQGTTLIAARAPSHGSSSSRKVRGTAGRLANTTLVLPRASGRLAGSVRFADGRPAAGVELQFPPREVSIEDHATDDGLPRAAAPRRVVITSNDGSFDAGRLPLGWQTVRVVANDAPEARYSWDITAAGSEPVQVVLSAGGVVVGVVTAADGRPVPGVMVQLRSDQERRDRYAATDAVGRYRFEGVPAGPVTVDAHHAADREGHVRAGESLTIDLRFGVARSIRGLLVDAVDQPLAGYRVHLSASGEPGTWHGSATTAADGTFEIANVTRESGSLEVRLAKALASPALVIVPWAPQPGGTSSPIRIVVPDERRPTGAVRFVVQGREQRVPESATCSLELQPPGEWQSRFALGPDGAAEVSALTAGTYTLTVGAQGLCERTITDIEVATGSVTDLGLIELAAGGTVRVALTAAGDALSVEPGMHWGILRPVGRDGSYRLDDTGQTLRSGVVPPGEYQVSVCGLGYRSTSRRVSVTADESVSLEIELEPGLQRLLEFDPPLSEGTRLRITSDDDEDVLDGSMAGASLFASGLWPGGWRAILRAPGREEFVFRFEVEDGETNWDAPIVIKTR